MSNEEIKNLALKHGFTERKQADGAYDLNLYVYAFANALTRARAAIEAVHGIKGGAV